MTTTINASTTAGLVQTADTSGVLALQTAGTTAVSIDASQAVSVTGTLSTTGDISVTKATGVPRIAVIATTGTNEAYLVASNTGGSYYFGVENSTGSWFGATAYAGVMLAPAGRVLQQVISGTPITTTSSAGLAVTGLVDISAATSGQIKFPATQNASANANTLDDYEEGTFTPSCVCTGQTITLGTAIGTYTKIGNVVRAQIAIVISSVSGAAGGNTTIAGFPFANGDTTYTAQGAIGYNDGFANTVGGTWMTSTNMLFRNGTRSSGNDIGGFTAGGYIFISIVYRV